MNLYSYNQSAKLILEDATKQLINLNRQLTKFTQTHSHYNALSLFQLIHSSPTFKPDHYSLNAALIASAKLPNLIFGYQLHAHAISTGFKPYPHVSNPLLLLYAKSDDLGSVKKLFSEMGHPDIYSWTTLLSACAKLGQVWYAYQLLDEMPMRENVAPWNAVITGCSENGCRDVAFDLFRRMCVLGVRPDNYTFAGVLGLCSSGSCGFGKQVHSLIVKSGFLDRSTVTNSLISMYFERGDVTYACRVFQETSGLVRDEITYNAMINGLACLGRGVEVLMMFKRMLDDCLRPTDLTFLSLMSAGLDPIVCFQLHSHAVKMGYESCTTVSNAAMSMYADLGQLDATRKIFQQLEYKDIVSWNTMLAAFAHNDCTRSAMLSFMEMQRKGIVPDEYTIGTLLSDAECSEDIEMLYALVVKTGLSLISEAMNALVSAFSKQGNIDLAYQIFCDLNCKNLITWNATISGYFANGHPFKALHLFISMQKSDVRPDICSLTSVLSICASTSSLNHGKQVHCYIIRQRLSNETSLGNGLITMYAKCGGFDWSTKVFDSIINRDVVTWNAIISACAQYGEGQMAVLYFKSIPHENGLKPDEATFTSVLSACSHAGLVYDGIQIFNSMVNDYRIKPGVDHFSCLVDLLGRAGFLDEAEGLLKGRGLEIHSDVWWTLLSACAAYGNVRLGRIVAGLLLQTEKNDPSVYVLLSNIHANAGQWDDAAHIRELITRVGVAKQPGCSWIKP